MCAATEARPGQCSATRPLFTLIRLGVVTGSGPAPAARVSSFGSSAVRWIPPTSRRVALYGPTSMAFLNLTDDFGVPRRRRQRDTKIAAKLVAGIAEQRVAKALTAKFDCTLLEAKGRHRNLAASGQYGAPS